MSRVAMLLVLALCCCAGASAHGHGRHLKQSPGPNRPVSATSADLVNDPTGRGHLLVSYATFAERICVLAWCPWVHASMHDSNKTFSSSKVYARSAAFWHSYSAHILCLRPDGHGYSPLKNCNTDYTDAGGFGQPYGAECYVPVHSDKFQRVWWDGLTLLSLLTQLLG